MIGLYWPASYICTKDYFLNNEQDKQEWNMKKGWKFPRDQEIDISTRLFLTLQSAKKILCQGHEEQDSNVVIGTQFLKQIKRT